VNVNVNEVIQPPAATAATTTAAAVAGGTDGGTADCMIHCVCVGGGDWSIQSLDSLREVE